MRSAPFVGAAAGLSLAALFTFLEYSDALADHAWTAAAIILGVGLMTGLLAAEIGWFAGSFVRRSAESGARARAGAAAVLGAALTVLLGAKTVAAHRHRAYLLGLRVAELAPERAAALSAGSPEERAALARNASCPPDLLVKLGHDPDALVRWGVSINHAAPKSILEELTRDADPSVSYNAAHTAAAVQGRR